MATHRDIIEIVADTREQAPLDFDGLDCTAERGTVPTYDYALKDDPTRWAVERKSLGDMINSITTTEGWRKERARRSRAVAPYVYIVEANFTDALTDYDWSRRNKRVTPQFFYHRIFEMIHDLGICVLFAGGRKEAAACVEGLLRRRYEQNKLAEEMRGVSDE